jgi:hypothetical protein
MDNNSPDLPLKSGRCFIPRRSAKRKNKPYKLPDGKGLYLEVKPNDVKAWRYRFELREGGKVKESLFAVGDYVLALGRNAAGSPGAASLAAHGAGRGAANIGRRRGHAEPRDRVRDYGVALDCGSIAVARLGVSQ